MIAKRQPTQCHRSIKLYSLKKPIFVPLIRLLVHGESTEGVKEERENRMDWIMVYSQVLGVLCGVFNDRCSA